MEIYDKHNHKRSKSKNYFSVKMNVYDKKQAQFTEEDKYEVLDKNLMVNIMGHDDVYDCLNEFMFKEKVNRLNPNVNVSSLEGIDFGRTRYVSADSNTVFFEKYHKFDEMKRKGTLIENTPSMAFINSCKKEVIVPNPVGIIKRYGNENDLNLK
jgi:hypothetical protein